MTGALPVLYSFRRCPYAMRARLALAVSAQACALREVVLRNKPAALLAASAKATVPVLVLPDGEVIDQSLDIMLWALRLNDPARWLNPPEATLDDMLQLIAGNDGDFKRQLDRYKYPNRYPDEAKSDVETFALAQRDLGAGWLAGLESKLASTATATATATAKASATAAPAWLYGARASLADIAVLPFVRQFAHTDPLWFAAQNWPHLRLWLSNFEASALYLGVMVKQPAWTDASSSASAENAKILVK